MKERLFVHLPISSAGDWLPGFIHNRLCPEFALKAEDLDRPDLSHLDRIGRQLAAQQLRCTLHAPFHDLNPGALDPKVAEVTHLRFLRTLEAAQSLGAELVVFHPGYERWRYGHRPELWLEQSLKFWPEIIRRAQSANIRIALENVFDQAPDPLALLLERLGCAHFGHCFDIGHWHIFRQQELDDWLERLGPHLFHLHLHDNDGTLDQHLALGDGTIELSSMFDRLVFHDSRPSCTLEAHSRPVLERSLAYLRKRGLI